MERLLRLLISLSLSGFVALVGLGLTCYSVLNMVIAYQDYKEFAERKAVLDLVAALQGDGANYVEIAEKVFFLVGFLPLVLIIPGLYLFGFGLRRVLRKVRQGLPEAAKKPQNKAEFWISTVIYGFGVLITAPALMSGLIKAPQSVPIVFNAIETPAKAVKAWPNENSDNEHPGTYFVRFEFLDNKERTVQSVIEVSAPRGENLSRHPNARIAYVPGRTDKIHFARSVPSIAGYLWSFIWRIGMLYVAVCGLLANFPPKKPSPLGRLASGEPPLSRSHMTTGGVRPTRAPGRKCGFGRRGLP
jgi:hypothetical protein